MYQALFLSLSSQRSKEAKKKKITPDLRLEFTQSLLFVSCFAMIGRAHNRRKTRHARLDQIRFGFAQTEVSFQWPIITHIKSFTSEYLQCLTSPPMLLDALLYSLPHYSLYLVVYLLIVFVS